jgi:hypothetical protein
LSGSKISAWNAPIVVFGNGLRLGRKSVRLIEDQPNGLAARHCRTPAPRFSGNEGTLHRRIIVFRCDLYHGCALDVQPALASRPYGLRSWSDKPLTHMTLVYLGTPLVSSG